MICCNHYLWVAFKTSGWLSGLGWKIWLKLIWPMGTSWNSDRYRTSFRLKTASNQTWTRPFPGFSTSTVSSCPTTDIAVSQALYTNSGRWKEGCCRATEGIGTGIIKTGGYALSFKPFSYSSRNMTVQLMAKWPMLTFLRDLIEGSPSPRVSIKTFNHELVRFPNHIGFWDKEYDIIKINFLFWMKITWSFKVKSVFLCYKIIFHFKV